MKDIHVVGAAILEGSRCLVAQRGEAMDLALKWEFPGGKVEAGEDPKQALTRELHEELGVIVAVGEWIGRGESVNQDRRILLDVYEVRLISGEPRAGEHHALRWCDADAASELDWAEADLLLIAPLLVRLCRADSNRSGDSK